MSPAKCEACFQQVVAGQANVSVWPPNEGVLRMGQDGRWEVEGMFLFVADDPADHLKGLDPKFFFWKTWSFFSKEKRESKFQQAPETSQNSLETRLPTCFFLLPFPISVEHQHFSFGTVQTLSIPQGHSDICPMGGGQLLVNDWLDEGPRRSKECQWEGEDD